MFQKVKIMFNVHRFIHREISKKIFVEFSMYLNKIKLSEYLYDKHFDRRRYKVVAEQYCKISPLICMICLFFKL